MDEANRHFKSVRTIRRNSNLHILQGKIEVEPKIIVPCEHCAQWMVEIAVGFPRIPRHIQRAAIRVPHEQRGVPVREPIGWHTGKILGESCRPAHQWDGNDGCQQRSHTACFRRTMNSNSAPPKPSSAHVPGSGTAAMPSISARPAGTSMRMYWILSRNTGLPEPSCAQPISYDAPPAEPA